MYSVTIKMTMDTMLILIMGMVYYAASVNGDPIAYIGESQIVGQKVRHLGLEVNQYLGIPYAEPPVGNLRFMRTKPVGSLPKVLMAVHQPLACHQYTKNPFPWYINSTEKSEDCLYLNIWTPTDASPKNTKAVMYWIHGGGFRYGSIRDELYSGIPLAALGDIVVVTANYRLGPLGFLTSNTGDAPGNAGLWDLLEGLQWVNKNIRAFGGDTTRVTLAGESVGSISVGLLSVSPLSRGLFTRQIMQSGSPASLQFENNTANVAMSQYLGTLVGCANNSYTIYDHPTDIIKCLKDVNAVTLSKLDMLLLTESTLTFIPQYGDEILPTNPHLAIVNGEFHSTELFSGVTRDEGVLLCTTYADLFGFFCQKDPLINKTTGKDIMRKTLASFPQPEAFIDHYLNYALEENDYGEVRHELLNSFGDEILACPTTYYAEKTAAKGNSVYFYLWLHSPSTTPWAPWVGAAHYTEVQFVFGQPVLNPQRYRPEEVQISLQMIEMWSSFVKYGKPSIPWPLYSKDFPILKHIGPGTEEQIHGMEPHRRNCDFLRPYYGF